MVIVKCQVCGKEFNCPPSHIKRGQGKYCSKNCFTNFQKGKPAYFSQFKGKKMKKVDPNYVNPMKGKERPDLVKLNKTKKYTQLGKNNPAYKHGKRAGYKLSSKLHYNMPCFSCGTFKDVHTHHMDEDHTNNVYSNFEWLCRACHSRYHRLKESHSISTINNE